MNKANTPIPGPATGDGKLLMISTRVNESRDITIPITNTVVIESRISHRRRNRKVSSGKVCVNKKKKTLIVIAKKYSNAPKTSY